MPFLNVEYEGLKARVNVTGLNSWNQVQDAVAKTFYLPENTTKRIELGSYSPIVNLDKFLLNILGNLARTWSLN